MTLYNLCLPEVVTIIMTMDTQTLTQSLMSCSKFHLFVHHIYFVFVFAQFWVVSFTSVSFSHCSISPLQNCLLREHFRPNFTVTVSGTVMLQKHFDITVTECDLSDRNLSCTILQRHKTLSQRSQRVSAPTATVCSVKLSYHSA